jgi:geranylgeranyl diphosphate synthase type 3
MLGYCDIMENLNMSLNYNQSEILRQRTEEVEVKKHCITLLEMFGSLSYTRRTLEELDAEIRAEVAKLGGNPMLEDILDEMLDWKTDTEQKHPEK